MLELIGTIVLALCTICAIYCTFCDLKDQHYWQAAGSMIGAVVLGSCAVWLAGMI